MIMIVLVAIAPVLVWAIVGAIRKADNDVVGWVDDHLPAKQTFSDFSGKFGRQDLLVVSWPGCTLDDPRLTALAKQISSSAQSVCFQRVTTTDQLLKKLTAPPFNLPRDRVIASLVGQALGRDEKTSCLILDLSKFGAENRGLSVSTIDSAAGRVTGLDPQALRMGGPAFEIWALTDESTRSPVRLCMITIVVTAIVSYALLRSLPICALVVGIAVFNGAFSIALVYFTGHGMNAILMPMPTLVMVLSVSCSVHVVNYYRKAVGAGSADVARSTLQAAWLPCVLSAATTAIGLIALVTSDTSPVREFGTYSAVAVIVGTTLILIILPATLSSLPGANVIRSGASRNREYWRSLAKWIHRFRWPVVVVGIVIFIACSLGLRRLDTSMDVSNTFAAETRVIQDAQWLEANVRPLSQLEVVVSFDDSNKQPPIRRLLLVTEVANSLRQHGPIDATLSLADFLPTPPTSRSMRSAARRAVLNRFLENNPQTLRDSGYWTEVDGSQCWRISMSVSSLSTTQYANLIQSATKLAETGAKSSGNPSGVKIECTGAIALYDEIQRQMLRDLLNTYVTAFLAITLTMCLVLYNALAGLIAMIPNVFPAVVMLGLLGWLDVRMDVGSIMTASVALGIAVDGTLHYVIAFRREMGRGSSQVEGIEFGYSRCGVALTQATIICALGIHILGYSDFLPTARFGWLIAAMLTLALIGDLVLLPALLAGPMGRLFTRVPAGDVELVTQAADGTPV